VERQALQPGRRSAARPDPANPALNRAELSHEELDGLERRTRGTIETFRSAGDAVNEARARVALACVLGRRGRAGDAQRELVEAASQAAAAGDLLTHHQAIGELGNLAMAAGQLDEAAELLEAALAGLLRAGDLSSVGRTHASLGALAELRAEPDEAARHRAEALATHEALEDSRSAERMRQLLTSEQ
jgi:tetratricopeptide (TPR) repeat protein